MVTAQNEYVYEFHGLSTDTKPIGNNCTNNTTDYIIGNGSVFFEMDTSKAYMLKLVSTTSEGVTTYTGSWLEI